MKNIKYIALFLLVLLFGSMTPSFGQDFPEPMQPRRIVNDFTQMFSSQEQAALEQKLRVFNDTSSTQIAVVTVPSLGGYDANDYAQRLAEKWGIGQKGKDNGILIVVKPKIGREKGEVAIAVGYGLEGVVPDAIASRIVRNEIIPAFKSGQYYTGINNATTVLMKLTGGEFTAEQYAKGGNGGFPFPILLILLLCFAPLFFKRRKGYTTSSQGSSAAPFIFFGGLGGFGGGRGNDDFGSFSSGSGGFGGFGGGGFGGGGASGSW